MKNVIVAMLIFSRGLAQTPSGDLILQRVDDNIGSRTKVSVGEMRIQERREMRTVRMKSWLKQRKESFTEFLDPARDRGTKMLKLHDQLWIYTPSTDRTILISGHMLRQSVMGSDLSYEDLLEDASLRTLYEATVLGNDTLGSRPCWVLSLSSRGGEVSYYARKAWVDRERFVILKEERYARSGKLLKTTEVGKVILLNGKWVVTDATVKDALKNGAGTEFIVEDVQLDVEIPNHLLTKAALRR
jgi:hypothetical protein